MPALVPEPAPVAGPFAKCESRPFLLNMQPPASEQICHRPRIGHGLEEICVLYLSRVGCRLRRTTRRERAACLFQDRGAGLSPCAGTIILKRSVWGHAEQPAHAGHASRDKYRTQISSSPWPMADLLGSRRYVYPANRRYPRATQLASSAVTASAVGDLRTDEVLQAPVGRCLPPPPQKPTCRDRPRC